MKKAYQMLKKLEWDGFDVGWDREAEPCCPICEAWKDYDKKHEAGCELKELLDELEAMDGQA